MTLKTVNAELRVHFKAVVQQRENKLALLLSLISNAIDQESQVC